MLELGRDAEKLKVWVKEQCSASSLLLGRQDPWPSSRWQPLPWPDVWMKREDELSFSMSGPKFRKFCGLGQALQAHAKVVAWGSARSAFLLGLAQLCRETGKELALIQLQSTPYQDFGTDVLYENAFRAFPRLWLSRDQWPTAAAKAQAIARDQGGTLLLPEGGACQETLAGALSLALDLTEQAIRLGIPLQELWIDSGSGFSAQALIWGLGSLLKNPPRVHVVLCAGTEQSFEEGLRQREEEARASLPLSWAKAPYLCHRPISAPAYGATNRKVWDKIAHDHQRRGILLDPLYTAKLMLSYEAFRETSASKAGPTLIIHSGGALNSFGFKDGLRPYQEP